MAVVARYGVRSIGAAIRVILSRSRPTNYDKLRDIENGTQQILVVLFLPNDANMWLAHSSEGLIARRCAYWVSLRGASPRGNESSQTVYIPQANVFSVDGLRSVFMRRSLGGWIDYE